MQTITGSYNCVKVLSRHQIELLTRVPLRDTIEQHQPSSLPIWGPPESRLIRAPTWLTATRPRRAAAGLPLLRR